jgi:hypothetical protein
MLAEFLTVIPHTPGIQGGPPTLSYCSRSSAPMVWMSRTAVGLPLRFGERQ